MKILMVNKFLHPNGGSETYVLKLGRYLETKGHEVQYFGMEHAGRCVSNRAQAYVSDMDFHGGFTLSRLTYPVKVIYSVEAARKIRTVLDDFGPDVVHLNNFSYQLTPSVLVEIKKWSGQTGRECRIIFTAHDYNLVCPNHMMRSPNTGKNCEKCLGGHFYHCAAGRCIHGSLVRSVIGAAEGYFWNRKKVYRFIDAVICCSAFMKSRLNRNPLFAGKTHVLYNFAEIERQEDSRTCERRAKKEYVLYFGRFSEEKGIRTLIEVCRALPEIDFVFAGSGPLEEALASVPNIRNAGFLGGEALKTLIREARFSVCPSEWYENCPFSVMESQIYGTPVLGAEIGGIPELIRAGETGELFESGNAADLKRKIQKLWEEKELTERYSENCRAVRFDTLAEYYEKLMELYRHG